MADAVKGLPKPNLRRSLHYSTRIHVPLAFVFAISCGLMYKVFVGDVRKKNYAEFYRNYDPQADFEAMRKDGIFKSLSDEDE